MQFAQSGAFRFTVFIAFLLPQYSFCNIIQFIAYPFCHLHIFHQIRISEKFFFHNTLQCIFRRRASAAAAGKTRPYPAALQ